MINKFYLARETTRAIKDSYLKNNPNHVFMQEFLDEIFYKKIKSFVDSSKGKHQKIPNKSSYEELLIEEINTAFKSQEFLKFLSSIIGKRVKLRDISVRRFKHRDYTLIHDEQKHEKLEKFIFFIPSLKEFEKEFGGNKIFQLENGANSITFTPKENSLVLIKQEKNDFDFVEYLNNLVGKASLVIVEGILTLV